MSEINDRINKGVALLDQKLARWVWLPRIDLATLDLNNGSRCLLAQAVQGTYYCSDAARVVDDYPGSVFGFDTWDGVDGPTLTEAWVQTIQELRGTNIRPVVMHTEAVKPTVASLGGRSALRVGDVIRLQGRVVEFDSCGDPQVTLNDNDNDTLDVCGVSWENVLVIERGAETKLQLLERLLKDDQTALTILDALGVDGDESV